MSRHRAEQTSNLSLLHAAVKDLDAARWTCALNKPVIEQVYDFSPRFQMNDLPPDCKVLKSLIAPARYSDGPTLYLICQSEDEGLCIIYEQMPDGRCQAWSEPLAKGVQQAEGAIYRQAWKSV